MSAAKTLFALLTKQTALPALTEQHLRIEKFLDNSDTVVKTRVWCTVSTYVLIAIVEKELQLDASLYSCLQILSVSVFLETGFMRLPRRCVPN